MTGWWWWWWWWCRVGRGGGGEGKGWEGKVNDYRSGRGRDLCCWCILYSWAPVRPLAWKGGDVWSFSKFKKYPYHWFFLGKKLTFIQKRWLEAPENDPFSLKMPKKYLFSPKVLTSSQKRTFFFQYQGHTDSKKIDPFSAFFWTMMRTHLLAEWRDWVLSIQDLWKRGWGGGGVWAVADPGGGGGGAWEAITALDKRD